jgi:Rrf2 family nitric oxide-sensitive transcriptional repressor
MRITAFSDYSMRLMVYVGIHNDRLVSIREVSGVYEISKNHLTKVVHSLGKGGYLETVRGKNGGFRLALPPKDINIGKLLRYTEDDFSLVECLSGKNKADCRLYGSCMLTSVMEEALEAFVGVLDKYSLEDILNHKGEFELSDILDFPKKA